MPPDPSLASDGERLDLDRANAARTWDYWLNGKDNYAYDREAGDAVAEIRPTIVDQVRAGRGFLVRAVRHLAADQGIRQFLDIGIGLPAQENTHEVAQQAAPESRVVYVDNDPVVLVHARALLPGRCEYVDGDLREPDAILREAAKALDLAEPVALLLLSVLHHVTDDADPYAIVKHLVGALAPGSFLVICHDSNSFYGKASDDAAATWNKAGTPSLTLRSRPQIAGFFEGLELLEPGLVSSPLWRPEPEDVGKLTEVDQWCGVGRKPEHATRRR